MNGNLTPSDIDAIGRVRAAFVAAVAEDDVDTMTALLTDDGQAFPPHEPALVGKAANREWHDARIAEFATEFSVSTDELIGAGPMAFELFSYTLTLTPRAGGEAMRDSGRCIWLWRREGDSWKVSHAMWNSPEPVPGS